MSKLVFLCCGSGVNPENRLSGPSISFKLISGSNMSTRLLISILISFTLLFTSSFVLTLRL